MQVSDSINLSSELAVGQITKILCRQMFSVRSKRLDLGSGLSRSRDVGRPRVNSKASDHLTKLGANYFESTSVVTEARSVIVR
jgi:hypothetical protein